MDLCWVLLRYMALERWGHKPSLVTGSLTLTLLELLSTFITLKSNKISRETMSQTVVSRPFQASCIKNLDCHLVFQCRMRKPMYLESWQLDLENPV